MFVLGLLGMFMLAMGTILAGWFTIIGMVYCMHPTSNYILGCLLICM
jgi:hypothetical protein